MLGCGLERETKGVGGKFFFLKKNILPPHHYTNITTPQSQRGRSFFKAQPKKNCYMASARAFTLSRITTITNTNTDTSFNRAPFSRHHHHHDVIRWPTRRGLFPASYSATVSCLSSGGGVSNDDFVSTRKSNFDRGFRVIANMLKRIEPLDNSVISKGISESAKDSMKQTISSMLGLLPSDQFSITVRLSKQPLHSLLVSSIITG